MILPLLSERGGGLMVIATGPWIKGSGVKSWTGHGVAVLGKTLYSHSAFSR